MDEETLQRLEKRNEELITAVKKICVSFKQMTDEIKVLEKLLKEATENE